MLPLQSGNHRGPGADSGEAARGAPWAVRREPEYRRLLLSTLVWGNKTQQTAINLANECQPPGPSQSRRPPTRAAADQGFRRIKFAGATVSVCVFGVFEGQGYRKNMSLFRRHLYFFVS